MFMSENRIIGTKMKLINTTQADTKTIDLHIVVHVLHQSFQGTFNQRRENSI